MLRYFLRSTAGIACLVALASTCLVWGAARIVPLPANAVDWSLYDLGVTTRSPTPISPEVVYVTRNAETDLRFGNGPLDPALLARVITGLNRAGAAVIGIETPLERVPVHGRGGAAGEAMLIEATRASGRVIFPLDGRLSHDRSARTAPEDVPHAWPLLTPHQSRSLPALTVGSDAVSSLMQYPVSLGHMLTEDNERRAILFAALGPRAVPSFGLAIALSFFQVAPENIAIQPSRIFLREARLSDGQRGSVVIPTDRPGEMIVNYARTSDLLAQSHAFIEVWEAIERGDRDRLQDWVGGKIVFVLSSDPTRTTSSIPDTAPSSGLIQAHALNTILTQRWIQPASTRLTVVITITLAWLASWALLSLRGWLSLTVIGSLFVLHLALAFFLWWSGHLVLPIFTPLASLLVAAGATSLWSHFTASHRIGLLEKKMHDIQRELTAVREDLIRRESSVESLEEDLEAARAAMARSTGKEQELVHAAEKLRAQLVHAEKQEETSRLLLQKLEEELSGLRATSEQPLVLHDAEQERLRQECEQLGIVTRDLAVLNVFRDLKKAAHTNLSILILGEAGSGKELLARAAHRLSGRVAYPFVAVNMAAISPTLFESELFGHVKGSFTGSLADRRGYFEQAHQGTLFLDEIGDLPMGQQGKLLRVLQEHSFYRVGESKPISVNVRIVAATNKDLQRGVIEGWFREDLFFRLKGVVLRLPSLRERPQDIRLLAERFVQQAAAASGRTDIALSQDAAATLQAHPWKGNIRELQHCIQQAVALAEGPRITRSDLRLTPEPPVTRVTAGAFTTLDTSGDAAVLQALREHRFDMQATARALGWDRSTVTQRLKGLSFRALVDAQGNRSTAASALAGEPSLVRTVELKLNEYYDHLIKTIQPFRSADEAIAACKKRFKNLPDRHFQSVEQLIRQHLSNC